MDQETSDDKIQKNVERLKAIALTNNIHKLTPPTNNQDKDNGVAIIEELRVKLMATQMRLEGKRYNHITKQIEVYRTPIMNTEGIGNFMNIIEILAESYPFGYTKEESIDDQVMFHFENNYPYLTAWHEDYELDKKDFNIIETILYSMIFTAITKGMNAKYINAIARTYSEDFMGKVMINEKNKDKGGFMEKFFPKMK